MDAVYSRCGMRCDLCHLYRTNVEKDDRRGELCRAFAKMFDGFSADLQSVICDGCTADKKGAVLFDPECKTRGCVLAKGYEHCGYCDQYPCEIFPAEPTNEELFRIIEHEHRWTWEEEQLMEAYRCRTNIDAFRRRRGE